MVTWRVDLGAGSWIVFDAAVTFNPTKIRDIKVDQFGRTILKPSFRA